MIDDTLIYKTNVVQFIYIYRKMQYILYNVLRTLYIYIYIYRKMQYILYNVLRTTKQ